MKEFQLEDQAIDCHVLWFDYGHLNGIVWVAEHDWGFSWSMKKQSPLKDRLNWFWKARKITE